MHHSLSKKYFSYFNQSTALKIYLTFFLLLIGVLLLICRNPDPFIHPIIYAEDGAWIGNGLTQGWFFPLLHARPDYLVMGNVVLLWIATQCSFLFFGNPIAHLPASIAFISCTFYSMVAVLAFYSTGRLMPLIFRVALFFLILLVPLGVFQNEVIGRIVQVGYDISFIAIILFYIRSRCDGFILKCLIDIALIFCAATNPLVIGLAATYLVWDAFRNKDILKTVASNSFLGTLLVVLSIYLLPRMMSNHPDQLQDAFDAKQLIEAIGARSILFSFIFPWYNKFSTICTVSLLIGWVLLISYSYSISRDSFAKRYMVFLFFGLVMMIVATLVMRPGVIALLHQYQTTYPDRYFMVTNITAIFLTLLGLSQLALSSEKGSAFLGWLGLSVIILIYSSQLSLFFEIRHPRSPIMDKLTFEDQVKSVPIPPGSTSVEVPIYPITWKMEIPSRWIKMLQSE